MSQRSLSQVITTIAGSNSKGDGGPATAAIVPYAFDVAVDAAGNVFFSDAVNYTVRKVAIDGTITTIAGTGVGGFSGDGGPAVNAQLNPLSIAIDKAGNLFIISNARVRKVDTNGIITTVVGNGQIGNSGDGGLAINAQLNAPSGLAVDANGNLYIADINNASVRKVDTNGIISRVAGTGVAGFSGDGGPAANARLRYPSGVVVDAAGNLYITDTQNGRIRKVDIDGIITTVAGRGGEGASGDGGPATNALLNRPSDVTVDASGNLYIDDNFSYRIRKVASNGIITTVAGGTQGYGGDGGPATSASLNNTTGITIDSNGNLIFADARRVRKISTNGTITTIAGNGTISFGGDGGLATNANLLTPSGLTVDGAGNLYISDSGNNRIRKVSAEGIITTIAGNGVEYLYGTGDNGPALNAAVYQPSFNALDGNGNLLIATGFLVRKVTPAGMISTIAGNNAGYSGDGGPATNAGLGSAQGVAIDKMGNIYIAAGSRIRRVDNNGIITTVVGTGVYGYSGDGGLAINANISPTSIAVDGIGNLYFSSEYFYQDRSTYIREHRIRKVDVNGIITTVVGGGAPGFGGDGGPATSAKINTPKGIKIDASGNLYFADAGNNRVRLVNVNGIITTIAGNGTAGFSGDGGLPINAALNAPNDIALAEKGIIYIADSGNNRVRKVTINLPPVVVGSGLASPQSATVGAAFSTATAYAFSDPEGRPLLYSSSSLPSGLILDANTGIVSGTPTSAGRFGVTIGATDDAGATTYSGFYLVINTDPPSNLPPVVTSNGILSPQSATVGVGVSIQTAYAFSDPEGRPLVYSSSSLPSGLRLNSQNGIVSGAPTSAGRFGVTIGATDDAGSIVYSGFYLVVSTDPSTNLPPVVVGNGILSPQSATAGVGVSIQTAYAFSDPEGRPLVYSSSSLPSGLQLNSQNGIVSGTPISGGTAGITIGATDDGGSTVYSGFYLTVNGAPYVIGGGLSSPQSGTIGVGMSIPTAYAFNDPEGRPLVYSSSSLPAGLSLNATTGVISGTPVNVGVNGITIGATDDGGSTVYSGFYITVSSTGGSRQSVAADFESGYGIQVRVLGNPTPAELVEVEIQGAQGKSLWLRSFDSQGRLISETALEEAGLLEHRWVRIGSASGLYYVRISMGDQQRIIKIVKY